METHTAKEVAQKINEGSYKYMWSLKSGGHSWAIANGGRLKFFACTSVTGMYRSKCAWLRKMKYPRRDFSMWSSSVLTNLSKVDKYGQTPFINYAVSEMNYITQHLVIFLCGCSVVRIHLLIILFILNSFVVFPFVAACIYNFLVQVPRTTFRSVHWNYVIICQWMDTSKDLSFFSKF